MTKRRKISRFRIVHRFAFAWRVLRAGKLNLIFSKKLKDSSIKNYAIDFDQRLAERCVFRDIVSCSLFNALLQTRVRGAVLDVGANLGQFGRRVIASTTHRVIFVEPNPALWPEIQTNVLTADSHLEKVAASDHAGKLTFVWDPTHTGAGRVVAPNELSVGLRLDVDATTVDELVARNLPNGEVLVGLKLDVEGHEESVLRGGASSIARHRPYICFEANVDEAGWKRIGKFLPDYYFVVASVPGFNYERNLVMRAIRAVMTLVVGIGVVEKVENPEGYFDGIIGIPNESKAEAMSALTNFCLQPVDLLS